MTEFVPLCSAVLELAAPISVGIGPSGSRTVGAITSVSVSGARLKATLASPASADWLTRTGPFGVIDARLLLRTDDDALIYVSYGGRLDVSNPAAGMVAYVAPVFETSDERYAWLNGVQAVGKGVFGKSGSVTTITYELFEVS